MKRQRVFWFTVLLALAIFLVHRFTTEMHWFNVGEEFELPQPVTIPEGLDSIRAEDCGVCHVEEFEEWKTSIHANAWKDPYFLIDFAFDGSKQICLNCHTPLVNQQENYVRGFKDSAKYDPILEPNPNFDPAFRDEGVTCAVCHIKDGVIIGPYGLETDVHPVKKDELFKDGNSACRRCHLIFSNRWDTFLKMSICGTFSEIEETGKKINCQKCHMPTVNRPIVPGGEVRRVGRHLWRGGHDPQMVKASLKAKLVETTVSSGLSGAKREFTLYLTNVGTEHRLPTGTPDRHLKVTFRLLDEDGQVIKEKNHFYQRIILWRPFMIDLWDPRLKYLERVSRTFRFRSSTEPKPAFLEAEVWYGLLRESRRKKIGYENKEPIRYRIYYEKAPL